MKKITRIFLPLITLSLCAPLAAMEKNEKMEKLEQDKLIVTTNPKVLQNFGAIYTPKKGAIYTPKKYEYDLEGKTALQLAAKKLAAKKRIRTPTAYLYNKAQLEKAQKLQNKFITFSEHFFGLSKSCMKPLAPQDIFENANRLGIKISPQTNFSALKTAAKKLQSLKNKSAQNAREIVDLTFEGLKKHAELATFCVPFELNYAKKEYDTFLGKIPTQKKILMLHFGDYMLAPSLFLTSLAESIKDDLTKDKTLYEKYKNEIENCSFKINKEIWKSTGTTYQKPALIKQHEDARKQYDDFVATSRTTNQLDTEKTFIMGFSKSRILTIDRAAHTGTFVFKDGNNVTATHNLENINPLVDVTLLDGTGYLFCDGINGKKNCIINLTTGSYHCVTTKDTSHWPRDMVNAQYWLPEEIPGYVTTKIKTTRKQLELPQDLVPGSGSEKILVEKKYAEKITKIFTSGSFEIKTKTNNKDNKIKISAEEKGYCCSKRSDDFKTLRYNKNNLIFVTDSSVFSINPTSSQSTIFSTNYIIDDAQISADGTQLVIDEDVEGIHTYHTFKLEFTQVPFGEWLTESKSWPQTQIMGTTTEVIKNKKKLREKLKELVIMTHVAAATAVGLAVQTRADTNNRTRIPAYYMLPMIATGVGLLFPILLPQYDNFIHNSISSFLHIKP